MKKVNSKDGTTIAYETKGTGKLLILVDGALAYSKHHGSGSLADELASSFKVVTYDRRGRGHSTDKKPYKVEKEIEDIKALINAEGGTAKLYGFSSGAVLALKATAALKEKITSLAVLEPPFGENTTEAKKEFDYYCLQMNNLLQEGKNTEAVSFFLSDMLPPDMLEGIKQSPDWKLMEAVAPTLAYDNHVMGDGAVPVILSGSIKIPVLVLVGEESPEFKHKAVVELNDTLPNGSLQIINGQMTLVPPNILAPILASFFSNN